MDYKQMYQVANKALGDVLLHADALALRAAKGKIKWATLHAGMIKNIIENADIQMEHLALSEEKPPHDSSREGGIEK